MSYSKILIGIVGGVCLARTILLAALTNIVLLPALNSVSTPSQHHFCAEIAPIKENISVFGTEITLPSSSRPGLGYHLSSANGESVLQANIPPGHLQQLGWHIGCSYWREGNSEAAIQIWRKYTPDATYLLAQLSISYVDAGDWESAESFAHFSESINPNPSHEKVKMYNRFCARAIRDANPTSTLDWCRKLAFVSNSQATQVMLGRAYLTANKYALARNIFVRLLEADPDWINGYDYLAQAYAGLDEWACVASVLGAVSGRVLLNEQARLFLAEAWLIGGRFEEATQLLIELHQSTKKRTIERQACYLAEQHGIEIGCATTN